MQIETRQRITQEQTQTLVLTQQMRQSLHVLCMNTVELVGFLGAKVLENPLLDVQSISGEIETESYHSFGSETVRHKNDFTPNDAPLDIPSNVGFRDSLMEQIRLFPLSDRVLYGSFFIIASLNERGYFVDCLEDVKNAAQITYDEASAALAAVQELDPAGVGARSVSECLSLQLRRMQVEQEAIYTIVQDHLEDVAKKEYSKIGKALHLSQEQVRTYCDVIRTLRPHPTFDYTEQSFVIVPDIFVGCKDGKVMVRLNEENLPKLVIEKEYLTLMQSDPSLGTYLREQYYHANHLMKAVHMRRTTLLKVAEAIIQAQTDYFLFGKALSALSLQQIAAQTGLHESTVSRAILGKYLRSSQGTFPLKYFLVREVKKDSHTFSTDKVLTLLKQLLEKNPGLSDNALAQQLAVYGFPVARRTVAKYRMALGVQSVYERTRA